MQGLLLSIAKASNQKRLAFIKLRACDSKNIVTAYSMPAKINCVHRLQFQKQLTPIVSNISLFENNQKICIEL